MSIFEEVGLKWDGVEYVVPADKVMGLVETIEDIITLEELHSSAGVKRMKLARAFAAALSYAGAKVSADEVYTGMFGSKAGISTGSAITAILSLMIPPEHIRESSVGKTKAKAKTKRRIAS